MEDQPRESPKPTLSDQIIAKSKISKFDLEEKQFLPAGCIEELVTLEAIIKELIEKDQLDPGDLSLQEDPKTKQVIEFVLGKAKKVFATTVISGLRGRDLGWVMYQFMELNFVNESLPVTKDALEKLLGGIAFPWSQTRIYNFCREQWRFLAPVFSQQNFKVNLEPDHILPFVDKSNLTKEGAFGQVFRVEIHPAHQKNPAMNVRLLPLSLNLFPNYGAII